MSRSKLHHYIPQLLLRRFSSDPAADNPPICWLDKKTGRTTWVGVRNTAAVTHYNRLQEAHLPTDLIEVVLGAIETSASELLRSILDSPPADLSAYERLDLATFIYFQHARTPRARSWTVFAQESAAQLAMMKYLIDEAEEVEQYWVDQDKMTPEEAAAWREKSIRDLDSGRLSMRVGPDREVGGMFLASQEAVPMIAGEMSWTLLHADGGLVLADHPVSMYDPKVPSPAHGVSWFSSDAVEVTLPVDPTAALFLTPGPPTWKVERLDPAGVSDINLRTYASAEWWLFGRTQVDVQTTRRLAKERRWMVSKYRPRPPAMHLLGATDEPTILREVKTMLPTEKPNRSGRSR